MTKNVAFKLLTIMVSTNNKSLLANKQKLTDGFSCLAREWIVMRELRMRLTADFYERRRENEFLRPVKATRPALCWPFCLLLIVLVAITGFSRSSLKNQSTDSLQTLLYRQPPGLPAAAFSRHYQPFAYGLIIPNVPILPGQ